MHKNIVSLKSVHFWLKYKDYCTTPLLHSPSRDKMAKILLGILSKFRHKKPFYLLRVHNPQTFCDRRMKHTPVPRFHRRQALESGYADLHRLGIGVALAHFGDARLIFFWRQRAR